MCIKKAIFGFFLLGSVIVHAQTQPKLVIGVVVDQMRQEYIYRFEKKFGADGFRRFLDQGFQLTNLHYNYAATETGPGHSSVYTGTTPALHGIIKNEWFVKDTKGRVNCVATEAYKMVGASGKGASPELLLSTTITDEVKIATQRKGKVVSVSLKDRSAVLPGGHAADAAYWMDSKSGNFITSSYYLQELPPWANDFNNKKYAEKFAAMEWKPALPLEQYTESGPDQSNCEQAFDKKGVTFPHRLAEMKKASNDYSCLAVSPYGNEILRMFAQAAIEGEKLGNDDILDFLAISFSSTDILGHAVGPQAVEIEDMYLRLDKQLAELFSFLDKKVGKGTYTLFLTADHAADETRQSLIDLKIPSGFLDLKKLEKDLNEFLAPYFPGKNVVESVGNDQIYLNHQAFGEDARRSSLDIMIGEELISGFLRRQEGIAEAYPRSVLRNIPFDEKSFRGQLIRSYNAARCGDIMYLLKPQWNSHENNAGTSHGTPYNYNTHVPGLFYGAGIKHGKSSQYHAITDIAPTISALAKIKFPSACIGTPVAEITD